MPGQPPSGLQFRLQAVGERLQVMRIVPGVAFHPLRQRAHRPVGFLRALLQLDAEVLLDQVAQTELTQAKQARGEHRIEDGAGHEFVVLAQQPQVVICAMHDQLVSGQASSSGSRFSRASGSTKRGDPCFG